MEEGVQGGILKRVSDTAWIGNSLKEFGKSLLLGSTLPPPHTHTHPQSLIIRKLRPPELSGAIPQPSAPTSALPAPAIL